MKCDAGGRIMWRKQVGTAGTDTGDGIAADANGDIYLVGTTSKSLAGPSRGGDDAWIMKYRLEPAGSSH